MDPKTRFKVLVSDTALKASVLDGFRRSLSAEPSTPLRPADSTPIDASSEMCPAKVTSTEGGQGLNPSEVTEIKLTKTSLDTNSNVNEEAAYQRGYEDGVRAKLASELSGLREQHRVFYDNLENLVDQNEVSDEEEESLKMNWAEMAWQMWPGRGAAGQRLRLTMAGFVLVLAAGSLLLTMIPIGSASERYPRQYSWANLEEMLRGYVEVKYYESPPT